MHFCFRREGQQLPRLQLLAVLAAETIEQTAPADRMNGRLSIGLLSLATGVKLKRLKYQPVRLTAEILVIESFISAAAILELPENLAPIYWAAAGKALEESEARFFPSASSAGFASSCSASPVISAW